MRPRWVNLTEQDRATFRATVGFLNGRLEERATVDWALRLKRDSAIKRLALLHLIDSPDRRKVREPWRSAWRLIEESWDDRPSEDDTSTGAYHVQHELRSGNRSGALISMIVELVGPRLKVAAFSSLEVRFRKPAKRPKRVEDLFSIGLTSGNVIDPAILGLGDVTDSPFLLSLATGLDAAVTRGLDIARRIGWDRGDSLWKLGQLNRVYYVPTADRPDGEHEPDEFHRGIAPSTKLLCAVISRLIDVDTSAAIEFVHRWRLTNTPVHLRLWAALSRDGRITLANEIANLLLSTSDRCFWNVYDFPEIAELRAKRFADFDPITQAAIAARIRKRPPRNHWPKEAEPATVENARTYWAARELRRIETAGAVLPPRDKVWLAARIENFPDLARMARIDEGFRGTPRARWVPPNPDPQYDSLGGIDRLRALETALASARGGFDDDPAERAADWIRQEGNPEQLLADLESQADGGAAFWRVWERFGWTHTPPKETEGGAQRNAPEEARRVLALLARMPEESIRRSIEGVSQWLDSWADQVVSLPIGLVVWNRVWPIAVEVTNEKQSTDTETTLSTVARAAEDQQPMDLDTLNTPAGKLVGVFLAGCPSLQRHKHPFGEDAAPRTMRNAVTTATGRSGLIARHRMIEHLPYFLQADPGWTNEHLITSLIADNADALALWRAIARQTRFTEVLRIIGAAMAERAVDGRLDRETRRSLTFSLVVECLHALREQREPAVPYARVQQTIRSLDDEVRAHAAEALQIFLRDVSVQNDGMAGPTREELFRISVSPFLQNVWPQERSLTTPGVSRAFADLPAASGEAFAEATAAIERFLVPFECWSMLEYGLFGEENGVAKLSAVNSQEKAEAFLRLLDLTIGKSEGDVVPYDLSDALDQIRKVAPRLIDTPVFRRLATAARRT